MIGSYKGSFTIINIFTSVQSVLWGGGGGQGPVYTFFIKKMLMASYCKIPMIIISFRIRMQPTFQILSNSNQLKHVIQSVPVHGKIIIFKIHIYQLPDESLKRLELSIFISHSAVHQFDLTFSVKQYRQQQSCYILRTYTKLYKVQKYQHFWCTLSERGSEKRVLFVHL